MRSRPAALPGRGRKPGPPAGLPDAPPSATRTRPCGACWMATGATPPTAWCTPASGPPGATSWRRRSTPSPPCWAAQTRASRRRSSSTRGWATSSSSARRGRCWTAPSWGAWSGRRGAGRAPPAGPRPRALSRRRRRPSQPGRDSSTPLGWCACVTQAIAPAVEESGPAPRRPAGEHPAGPLPRWWSTPCAGCSPCWPRRWRARRLRVVGARYDLDSGLVEVIVP